MPAPSRHTEDRTLTAVTSLAFDFGEPAQIWSHIPIEDPRARVIYDRHYSRQTVGAEGIVAPGERFLMMHEGVNGAAIWAVVRNRFRGQWYWRNSIFRNESRTLSSLLIEDATRITYELWARRYGQLPPEDLITEIDIEATRARRSKRSPPGRCYLEAGWLFVREIDPGHGRPARVVLKAPAPPC
jgi:hypothetical protein